MTQITKQYKTISILGFRHLTFKVIAVYSQEIQPCKCPEAVGGKRSCETIPGYIKDIHCLHHFEAALWEGSLEAVCFDKKVYD
eukprot:6484537-Amphidinium_carterae.2